MFVGESVCVCEFIEVCIFWSVGVLVVSVIELCVCDVNDIVLGRSTHLLSIAELYGAGVAQSSFSFVFNDDAGGTTCVSQYSSP